jgi:hypothetical protein
MDDGHKFIGSQAVTCYSRKTKLIYFLYLLGVGTHKMNSLVFTVVLKFLLDVFTNPNTNPNP